MKRMKRIAAWLLILIMMLSMAVSAEETTEAATYNDAAKVFQQLSEAMLEIASCELDEDTMMVLSNCATQLVEVQMGFQYAADDGSDTNLFEDTIKTSYEYSVAPAYITEFDYKAGFDVFKEDAYARIESKAFDNKTDEQLDYLRFEVARREDTGEIMLLFTHYVIDGFLSNTSRYLICKNEDSVQLLYSRTFGEALEYRIDLTEWVKGTDYTWSKELLYPALAS